MAKHRVVIYNFSNNKRKFDICCTYTVFPHFAKGGGLGERRGLPSAFRKQLDNFRKPIYGDDDDGDDVVEGDDEVIDSDEGELNFGRDLYEYEEEVAEEESKKNRRFDHVDNFEYELPEKFKDEDILSDEEDDDDLGHGKDNGDSDHEKVGDGKHARMLQDITGIPTEAFEGRKRKRTAVSEAYPESEFNPSRDVLSGNGQISIQDILDPLRGAPSYSKLRNVLSMLRRKEKQFMLHFPNQDGKGWRGVQHMTTQRRILLYGSTL